MASRHDELMNRICNAQIHAGEQEVLKRLAEIEGRPAPAAPKTYNEGLETAALYHDKMAENYQRTGGGPMSVQHVVSAAAIRALAV